MKKQKFILLAFIIPVIVTILASCSVEKYGCPKAKDGNWHGRQNMTVLNDSYSYPDCVAARETK